MDRQDLVKKYIELSEVYLAQYDDQSKRDFVMMTAKGILVEMHSDLIFFEKKRKSSGKEITESEKEKIESQMERLKLLSEAVNEFAGIHNFNFQIKNILTKMHINQNRLEAENEELRDKLKEANQKIEIYNKTL